MTIGQPATRSPGAPPAHATGTVELVPLADIADDETFRLRPSGDVSLLATSIGRLGQLSPVELRPWPGGDGGPCWQAVSGFRRLAAVHLLARDRVLARIHRQLPDRDAWALAVGAALLSEPFGPADLESLRERLRSSGVAPWADELIDEALLRFRGSADPPQAVAERAAASELRPSSDLSDLTSAALSGAPPGSGSVEAPADASGVLSSSEPDAAGAAPIDVAAALEVPACDGVPLESEDVIEVTPEELVEDLTARLYALNQDLVTAFEAWEDLPVDGRRLLVEQARFVAELLPLMEGRR